MIQFQSVTKKYPGEIEALSDISFEVEPGEFLFLVGPSGSGKTTIIKLLIREENLSSGKIYFDDDDITRYNRNKIYHLRRKIGVIFQDFKLIPELTAYENIAFAMEAAGRSEGEIKENVPYLLDIVGLSPRAKFFPRMLSGGEQQRVAIARAMANNPKLLIADEPTGNLDPDSAWDIVQILSKINNWGTTVIMSTHGFDIVNTLHKRVIRLEEGKIVRDDLKGSYDNVDEFSLKIISAQGKANKNAAEAKKGEEDQARKLDKLKQESNKNIKISTKKKKIEVQLKPEVKTAEQITEKEPEKYPEDHPQAKEEFGNKILANLEDKLGKDTETEIVSEATIDPIRKLALPEEIKQKLSGLDYHNLDEIIEAGMEKLKSSGEFKKDELKTIADFIAKFINEVEKNEIHN